MVKMLGSNQYIQLVANKLSVEIKVMVSCQEGVSARLAMQLHLAVGSWEGSKALASGGGGR